MTEEQKAAKAASQKRWYEKNKKKHIENVTVRKNRIVQEVIAQVRALKEVTPCTDCGINYPYYVMDFDHLSDKEYQISAMLSQGYSMETVQKEIDKCEIVCSNCHRIRTHERRNNGSVTQLAE
jgi:hypothetical protein